MSTHAHESRPGAGWLEVLARIESSLEQTLAQAPEPPEPPGDGPAGGDGMSALDGRLEGLRAALGQAERAAGELEAVLAEQAAGCENWLREAAEVRGRLARP